MGVQKWIQEDKLSFLVQIVNRHLTLPVVADAIRRFQHLGPVLAELPSPARRGVEVALIRRFFSDQLEFINIAKQFILLEDFGELLQNLIFTSESHGKLGGKSAGLYLAMQILKKSEDPEGLLAKVKTPKTWRVTSDILLYFMHYNDLDDVVEQKYKEINQVRQVFSVLRQGQILQPLGLDTDFAQDEPVVTFKGLIADTPFVRQMKTILEILEQKLQTPVDLEFAADGENFYLLQCRRSGLIRGRLLHIDATTIRADIDRDRVHKPDSSDPDARFGRFPHGRKEPGYKQQTVVDDQSRVVLAVSVMPANVGEGGTIVAAVDDAIHRGELAKPPEAVCADSAYASGANRSACEQRGIRLVSPPRQGRNHHSAGQFTIEQFVYDEQQNVFMCPSGKMLVKAGRFSGKGKRWKYRASIRDCRACSRKAECTRSPQRCLNVSAHHAALVRLRADSQRMSFRQVYRRRAPVIEGIFAEAKQWHGLHRAWRRGLAKVRMQCLLIAAVLNFKRLAAAFARIFFTGEVVLRVLSGFRELLRRFWRKIPVDGHRCHKPLPIS